MSLKQINTLLLVGMIVLLSTWGCSEEKKGKSISDEIKEVRKNLNDNFDDSDFIEGDPVLKRIMEEDSHILDTSVVMSKYKFTRIVVSDTDENN